MGLYAVATGIVDRAVTLVFMAVTLGAFPLAIDALERDGVAAARRQLMTNATALLALAVPAVVGIACLARPIADVLVGPDYRAGVVAMMPAIALLSLLRGFTVHYFDHALHLGCRTDLFLFTVGPAAAVSLVLNPLLIPRLGIMGAIHVALTTQALALVSTIVSAGACSRSASRGARRRACGLASTAMAGALASSIHRNDHRPRPGRGRRSRRLHGRRPRSRCGACALVAHHSLRSRSAGRSRPCRRGEGLMALPLRKSCAARAIRTVSRDSLGAARIVILLLNMLLWGSFVIVLAQVS